VCDRSSGQWKSGITEDEKNQVRYYEYPIVVEYKQVIHVFNDENGDEILFEVMNSALSSLVDCVLAVETEKVGMA
jgi:hypothetical protein